LLIFFLFNNSTQTTLRQTLGARILQDCIENRDAIAFEIKEIIDEPASNWGVKVNNCNMFEFFIFLKAFQDRVALNFSNFIG
jgi:hypothetical protein